MPNGTIIAFATPRYQRNVPNKSLRQT